LRKAKGAVHLRANRLRVETSGGKKGIVELTFSPEIKKEPGANQALFLCAATAVHLAMALCFIAQQFSEYSFARCEA
jgi:hypothetical protein